MNNIISRKEYPTRIDVDKYFGLVNDIDNQRDRLNIVVTHKNRLHAHSASRNKSLVSGAAITLDDTMKYNDDDGPTRTVAEIVAAIRDPE